MHIHFYKASTSPFLKGTSSPVSICIISFGVDVGVRSILLSVLFSIFCMCSTSVFVGIHVSAAYSSMGRMHVSTSFHMVFISIWLKFLLPARLNIVCSAASVLPLSFFMWSSIVPLLLIVIPRYLYVSVLSITMVPSLNLGSWFFPIVIVWLFSLPNLVWYLLDTSSVISSIFWEFMFVIVY